MLNKKWLLIIISVIILILILIGIYFIFFNKSEEQLTGSAVNNINRNVNNVGQLPAGGEPAIEQPAIKPPVMTAEEREQREIKNRTKFFVEMLGSYSSPALFSNITQLKPMMTSKMQTWADNFINVNLPNIQESDEQITTYVLKMEVLSYTGSRATALAYARRDKSVNGRQKLYNQEAEVDLVKIDGAWLVDGVRWK